MRGTIIRRLTAAAAAIVLCFSCAFASASSVSGVRVDAAPLSSRTQTMNGMVRVWLSSLGSPTSLNLTVRGKYSLSSSGEFLSDGTRVAVSFNSSTGAISISYNGQKKSVGKSFSLRRHSASGTNGILIAESRESQNPYPGDLSFEAVSTGSGYRLYVIAHVYIENYLYGVLPYEMGNSTNIEALKAQAVAARTYTVRMMKSRASGRYDVQDTTSDQVYRGTPSGNANCVAAIDQTKGIVLMYGSSYITTYYSASNGGQTETSRSGSKLAYLPVKDDPFDYANTSSTVKKKTIYTNLQSSSNPAQLMNLLKTRAISRLNATGYAAHTGNTTLQTLKSITPHTPKYASPSRLYTKMDFTFTVSTQNVAGQTVTVTQTVTCDIFDELESMLSLGIQSSDNELWSVEPVSSGLQIQARRYGHGMGMSQRGAMHMARLGYTYDEILGFYYEGCDRVSHSFTSSILSSSSTDEEITVEDPAELETEAVTAGKGRVSLSSVGARLAIRDSRSADGRILTTASNGAIVTVLSRDGDWCLVRYGEVVGYVQSASLVITGEPTGETQLVTAVNGFVTVTANDYVNLRQSGSMSAKVLGTAPAGAVLTVLSPGSTWLKVQYDALVAYVNSGFVSALADNYPSGSDFSEPESPSPDEDGETEQPGDQTGAEALLAVVATEYGSLNLRADASAASRILTTIPKGEVIVVEDRGEPWSRVHYRGQTGYVMSCYLSFAEQEPEADTTPSGTLSAMVTTPGGTLNLRSQPRTGSEILRQIPQNAWLEVHEKGPEWCGVTYQGISGYVMTVFLTFTSTPENDDGEADTGEETPDDNAAVQQAVVTTASGSLNLRAEPSLNARVLRTVPRQALVDILQYDFDWCRIRYQDTDGYAMTEFLTVVNSAVPDEPENESDAPANQEKQQIAYVQTVSGGLNLRAEPGSSYRVIATIPRNAQVTVTSYGDAWCAVNYAGIEGFVMTSFLRFEEMDTEEEQPETAEPETPESQTPAEEMPDLTNAADAWVSTRQGSLNLRETADSQARVTAEIPQFAQVKLINEGNPWSYVAYQNHCGYVMTRYLTLGFYQPGDEAEAEEDEYVYEEDSAEEPAEPETEGPQTDPTLHMPENALRSVNISGGDLSLWAMCWKAGAPLGKVPAGEMVDVILLGDTWCCVAYESIQGYCLREELGEMTP